MKPSQIDRSSSSLGAAMFQSPSAATRVIIINGSYSGTGSARLNPHASSFEPRGLLTGIESIFAVGK